MQQGSRESKVLKIYKWTRGAARQTCFVLLWGFSLDGWRPSWSLKTAGKVDSVGPAIGFPGQVQEEDVIPASTAFTTMISQPSYPPFPVRQLHEGKGGGDLKQVTTQTQKKLLYHNLHVGNCGSSDSKINTEGNAAGVSRTTLNKSYPCAVGIKFNFKFNFPQPLITISSFTYNSVTE